MEWKRTMVLAAGLAATALAQAGEVTIAVTPERQSLAKEDDVVVTVTVSNASAATHYLLKWQTPFGPLEASLFEVTRDGQPVRYLGIQVKRRPPAPSDYLARKDLGQRYLRWFGAPEPGRAGSVAQHFAAIGDAFASKPVTVDCGCNASYYAYVYPNQPYKIYDCKAFWSAPRTGTDSKGGTLVHEMSHFTVVAGTGDWAYGQSAAATLAQTDPAKAADNADTHECFGENSPPLP